MHNAAGIIAISFLLSQSALAQCTLDRKCVNHWTISSKALIRDALAVVKKKGLDKSKLPTTQLPIAASCLLSSHLQVPKLQNLSQRPAANNLGEGY
jgi:hypothetical protein